MKIEVVQITLNHRKKYDCTKGYYRSQIIELIGTYHPVFFNGKLFGIKSG